MEATYNPVTRWTFPQMLAFRIFCVYFVLYIFPFPFNLFDSDYSMTMAYYGLWLKPVQWVGKNMLGIANAITVLPNGSGDTTYNYVQVFIFFGLALIIGNIWTVLDRKRRNYNQLYHWLRVFIRYYLAFTMFGYGFAKVFKTQFPFPRLSRLLSPVGEISPMGLVWRFMGYSYGYNLFTGGMEVLGGLLLLFRKTTTLGALITIGVMLNVAMLNFCFDVPVKLYSLHLLAMAIFLTIPDFERLIKVLILNKPTDASVLNNPLKNKNVRIIGLIVKTLLIGYVLYSNISGSLEAQKQWGDQRVKPPLYGIYEVEKFVRNGDTLPPLLTDGFRWKHLIVESPGRADMETMNEIPYNFSFDPDTTAKTVDIYMPNDTLNKFKLRYEQRDSTLVLEGYLLGDTIYTEMRHRDLQDFLLVNRGFNWINEYPFHK